MYPPEFTDPIRKEVVAMGLKELLSADDVKNLFEAEKGTVVVLINSVCGCAAANARPGVKIAMDTKPEGVLFTTAFAGVHKEAVDAVRGMIEDFPPSSPSIAVFKDGKCSGMLERHNIEGHSAEEVADELKKLL